ncbi:fatty-acyl-CoA synthase [Longimycelium tulufanense]|uniref:Fatty-acyl-CoA synthase n=1 Tax=Longimycelium tulufanense TaxID=907463 RepID=A0A8J3CH33_9PSEU|nr:acyl-CoA synthetase [Longimycelium tulufanense]GGM66440.1 fatty-acyl-CoA synthase [Longimycelium tulufanense]
MNAPLLPALTEPDQREAIRFGQHTLTYRDLAGTAGWLARQVTGAGRVAVWADSSIHTCVAVVGCLLAGVPVVPINPKVGERELTHIVNDSKPSAVLAAPGVTVPSALAGPRQVHVDIEAREPWTGEEPPADASALIVYTSGTTGSPKGVVLPRRALASNLDALSKAWEWTSEDVLVHALPLFHVHGLVLGVLGPLRLGGTVQHLGRFDPEGIGTALARTATMMFGVPTMYQRLLASAEADPELARALGRARLLVSGSAALPATVHERIHEVTGQRVVERYGMTETLMNCAIRASGDRRPGTVGPAVDTVDLRLVDETGQPQDVYDDETVGEIEVRGPNLFLEYLNRPDATAAVFHDGWFRTGDMATRAADGYYRIVGRRATDLIKSGGYKIGAGEIENALLEHPDVAEVAVTGEPDADLGERVVAWVVPVGGRHPSEQELTDHVARLLAPHKRPRTVRYLNELPRNDMGKVVKTRLIAPPAWSKDR